MKSQFPSAISGLRGQGPDTLSEARRPTRPNMAALAPGGWHGANGPVPPRAQQYMHFK